MTTLRYGKARYKKTVTTGAMVLLLMVVVGTRSVVWCASKPKDDTNSEVYWYSVNDVFEASQAVLAAMKMSVEQADKAAAKITGTGKYVRNGAYVRLTFNIFIESVSAKPETRVTVEAKPKGFNLGLGGGFAKAFKQEFFVNLQKTLAVNRRRESSE